MADQLQPQQATSSLPEIDDEVLVGVATGDVNNDGTPDILGLAGDFNSDGTVDAADYVVQPDQLRSVTRPHNDGVVLEAVDADGKLGPRTEATAEPAPDGDVDGADFLAWQRAQKVYGDGDGVDSGPLGDALTEDLRGSSTLLPDPDGPQSEGYIATTVLNDWIANAQDDAPDTDDLDLDVDL